MRLGELVRRHGLVAQLAELGQDRAHGLVGTREIDAGLRVERSRVEVLPVLCEHVVGEAAALAHLGEEARGHAAAEHRRRELDAVAVGVPDRQAVAADPQMELVGVLRVQPDALPGGRRERLELGRLEDGPRAEQLLRRLDRGVLEAAAEADERALGRVPAIEVARERVSRGPADGVLVADDRPPQRRVAEAELVVHVGQVLRRRVAVHVHLLDDHALLALDLLGVEARVEEHVGEHVERLGSLVAGALDVVARVLLAGEGIEVGAHRVDLEADVTRGRTALGALEEEVLGEVGDTASAGCS